MNWLFDYLASDIFDELKKRLFCELSIYCSPNTLKFPAIEQEYIITGT